MKCYHRTTLEVWEKIKKEKILFGVHDNYRYTYLSPSPLIPIEYGELLLEVEYVPTGIKGIDNFGFEPPDGEFCWQFSVFIPIPIENIRILRVGA